MKSGAKQRKKKPNKKKYWELHRFHSSETFSVSVLCLIFTVFNSVVWFSMRWFFYSHIFGSCYNWLISSVGKPTKEAYDRTISTSNTMFFQSFFVSFSCFRLICHIFFLFGTSCNVSKMSVVSRYLTIHQNAINWWNYTYTILYKLSYVHCSHSRSLLSGTWTLNILGIQLLCSLLLFILVHSVIFSSFIIDLKIFFRHQNEKRYQWMKEWKINRFLLVCLKSDKFMNIMHELIVVKM